MKHRKHIIEDGEVLLIKIAAADGTVYWGEATCGIRFVDWAALINDVGTTDGVRQIVRFDNATLTGEDISEECAANYCRLYPDAGDPESEGLHPPFVTESSAYENARAEWDRVAREDARYGTYEQQVRRQYRRAAGY